MKISFLVRARRMRADGREEAVEESRIDYIDIRKRQSVAPYLLGPTNTHSHPWKGEDSILYASTDQFLSSAMIYRLKTVVM